MEISQSRRKHWGEWSLVPPSPCDTKTFCGTAAISMSFCFHWSSLCDLYEVTPYFLEWCHYPNEFLQIITLHLNVQRNHAAAYSLNRFIHHRLQHLDSPPHTLDSYILGRYFFFLSLFSSNKILRIMLAP